MPITFKSTLSSTVANATFLDKTVDDTTIGVLGLNNSDVASGAAITNAQGRINQNTPLISAQQAKSSNDQIALSTSRTMQVLRPIGSGGAVTLNNLLFSNQPIDGTVIKIIGQDDTNTVRINHNDAQYGQLLMGDAILSKGYALELFYDGGLERFIELSRNF